MCLFCHSDKWKSNMTMTFVDNYESIGLRSGTTAFSTVFKCSIMNYEVILFFVSSHQLLRRAENHLMGIHLDVVEWFVGILDFCDGGAFQALPLSITKGDLVLYCAILYRNWNEIKSKFSQSTAFMVFSRYLFSLFVQIDFIVWFAFFYVFRTFPCPTFSIPFNEGTIISNP